MLKLSIVIVNYKTAALVKQCIESIYDFEKELSIEIIVVDNCSNDNVKEILDSFINENISYIQMGYNSGFSRANNAGMKIAKGEYILLLNSDTYLTKANTLKNTLEFLKTKTKKDVLAPVLLHQDLSYQCSARNWYFGWKDLLYANPFFIYFTRNNFDFRQERNAKDKKLHEHTGEVKWINGAFQMFHHSIITEFKLYYDNDFFLYGEDVEWAYRINKNGGRFYLLHSESLIHLGSASSENLNMLKTAQIELSNWLFIKKSFGRLYFIIYIFLDFLNMFIDEIFWRVKTKGGEETIQNKKIRKIKKHLYSKYWWQILNNNNKTSDLKFNVYENDKKFIQTQTN